MTPPRTAVAIRTPAKFRLTAPVAPEDQLSDIACPGAALPVAVWTRVFTAWDLSNFVSGSKAVASGGHGLCCRLA